MFTDLKKKARNTVKRHWALLVLLSFMGVFLGTESAGLHELFRQEVAQERTGSSIFAGNSTSYDILQDVLQKIAPKGAEFLQNLEQHIGPDGSEPGIRGFRLAFSYLNNALLTGEIFTRMIETVNSFLSAESATVRILLPFAFILYALLWIFAFNMIPVVAARMTLEARTYEKVPMSRMMHLVHAGSWRRAAGTMLLMRVYQQLWNLTIIGGVIRHYSYFLVPYIVAEDPAMRPGEAIAMSKRMMQGHKKQAFLLEMSLLGWELLGLCTMGIVNLFWTKPYKRAVYAEYYAMVREQVGMKEMLNRSSDAASFAVLPHSGSFTSGVLSNFIPDMPLFTIPDRNVLREKYRDIYAEEQKIDRDAIILTGARKWLAENLGIWIGSAARRRQYQENNSAAILIEAEKEEMEGISYPIRMNPAYVPEHRRSRQDLVWARVYSVWSLTLMFIGFSFFGWLWEVSLHMVQYHELVNRGILHGPWLPIYGTGAVLFLLALYRARSHPGREFWLAILVAGIVEYCAARYLELGPTHARYWDYHGLVLNLDGRICAESLITFGVMGLLVVYVIAPIMDVLLEKGGQRLLVTLAIILLGLFLADTIYSQKNPNGGNGVAVDITKGAWPTTFWHPDHLKINGVMCYTMEEAIRAERIQ